MDYLKCTYHHIFVIHNTSRCLFRHSFIKHSMVKTRAMLSNDDPVTPPPPQRDDRPVIAKLLFPVPPQSAEKAPLSSPMQHEHDHSPKTKSRRIGNISDYTRIRLRRRIQKIYEMSTDVVEGYSTFYYNKHDKPLPQ